MSAILDAQFISAKITYQRLGDLAGISRPVATRIVQGHQVPNLEQLDRMCIALGRDIAEVVTEATKK